MQQETDSPEHHRQRSEFIRKLVQRRLGQRSVNDRYKRPTPKTIVQFWHDLGQLPHDVEECVASWTRWEASGFKHRLFDEHTAEDIHQWFVGCAARARLRTLLPPGNAGRLLPALLPASRRRLLCRCGRCLRWYRHRLAVRGLVGSNSSPSATTSLLGQW